MREDTRIAYGANCTWWGDITDVGKAPRDAQGYSLPCCPHCGGMLFEMPSEKVFMDAADKYEREAPAPGYRAMIDWSKGQCFPSFQAVQVAYAERDLS